MYTFVLSQDVVKDYEQHNIPLDVLVLDMDWHITFYKEGDAGKKDQVHLFHTPSAKLWEELHPNHVEMTNGSLGQMKI